MFINKLLDIRLCNLLFVNYTLTEKPKLTPTTPTIQEELKNKNYQEQGKSFNTIEINPSIFMGNTQLSSEF